MGEIYRGHNADFRVNLADRIVLDISQNFYSISREATLSLQRQGVRGEKLFHGKFLPNQFSFVEVVDQRCYGLTVLVDAIRPVVRAQKVSLFVQ